MKTVQNHTTLEDYINLNYPVTFYPEREGGYTVIIQDLPGCISTGEALQEAMANILDAKKQWIETAFHYQDTIPLPSNII